MKYLMFAKILYKMFLRKVIKDAIDDPKKDWDDEAMKALDQIFG